MLRRYDFRISIIGIATMILAIIGSFATTSYIFGTHTRIIAACFLYVLGGISVFGTVYLVNTAVNNYKNYLEVKRQLQLAMDELYRTETAKNTDEKGMP